MIEKFVKSHNNISFLNDFEVFILLLAYFYYMQMGLKISKHTANYFNIFSALLILPHFLHRED